METGVTTDYCLSLELPNSYEEIYPIWSPDGNQIIIHAENEDGKSYSYDIFILDLEKNIMFKVADDRIIIDWIIDLDE